MMKTVKIQDIDVCLGSYSSFSCVFASQILFWLRIICCIPQNLQDDMMDLMDESSEIQETLGRSYNVPDDIDEDDLLGGKFFLCSLCCLSLGLVETISLCLLNSAPYTLYRFVNSELDALEADMGNETEADGVPSYLQPDKEPDLNDELNLPSAPMGHTGAPPGRAQVSFHLLI